MNDPDLLTIDMLVFDDAFPWQSPQPPELVSSRPGFPPGSAYNIEHVHNKEMQSVEKRNMITSN